MTAERTGCTDERGYWRHASNGEVWAIETNDGQPVRCCGPIDARDAEPILLPHLSFARRDLDLIRADWHQFWPLEFCVVCHGVIRHEASTTRIGGARKALHVACALNPPSPGTHAVGAAVRVEDGWQWRENVREHSRALQAHSRRLRERSQKARSAAAGLPGLRPLYNADPWS
jgi:hypothetical protein